MGTIVLWIILIILLFITFGLFINYKDERKKDKRSKDTKNYFRLGILFSIVSLILFFVLVYPSSSNENKSSEPKTEKKTKNKSNKKDTEKEKADKKEKKEVADARKKNMANNLEDYKKDLADVPNKTNGLISKAYISPENGETIVVLSDDTLQPGDSQMEEVAHSAWNAINSMSENYKLSENENTHANLIEIQDQAGDTIAKTSFMGNFKYKGNK